MNGGTGQAAAAAPDEGQVARFSRWLLPLRLCLMGPALGLLLVPAWGRALGLTPAWVAPIYLAALAQHVLTHLWLPRPGARAVVYLSLCLDLALLFGLLLLGRPLPGPWVAPLLPLYALLFVRLYPSLAGLLPPLLLPPAAAAALLALGRPGLWAALLPLSWSTLVLVALGSLVLADQLSRRRRQAARRRARRRRLEQELAEERQRIAAELHDAVGSALSAVTLQAADLELRLAEGELGGAELCEELALLRQGAEEGQAELRRCVSTLRPQFRLARALGELCELAERRHRLAVTCEVVGAEPGAARPEQELALYRVAQEALSNALRHGRPARVSLRLRFGAGEATLSVEDDGAGFTPPPAGAASGSGFGLRSMERRLSRLGGSLELHSAEGQGTRVVARLPLPGPDAPGAPAEEGR